MDRLRFLMLNGSHKDVSDYIEAEIAAGNVEAMLWKGECYEEEKYGYGGKDRFCIRHAHYWYFKAAALGNKEALFCLIDLHDRDSYTCSSVCSYYAVQDALEKYNDDPLFTEDPKILEQLAAEGNYWAQRKVFFSTIQPRFHYRKVISDCHIELLKQLASRGHPLACQSLIEILLRQKISKHEAWKYHLLHQRIVNGSYVKCPLALEGFERVVKCQSACITWIWMKILPKDVVILIAKVLWETRQEDCWGEETVSPKRIKLF